MSKKTLIKILKLVLLPPLALFCVYISLLWLLAPKVILINQSGKDLQIFSYYFDSEYDFLKSHGDISIFIEEGRFKNEKYQKEFKRDKKLVYKLVDAGRGSIFWANWFSSDKTIDREMEFSLDDFVDLRKMIITVDKHGHYQKEKLSYPLYVDFICHLFYISFVFVSVLSVIVAFFTLVICLFQGLFYLLFGRLRKKKENSKPPHLDIL